MHWDLATLVIIIKQCEILTAYYMLMQNRNQNIRVQMCKFIIWIPNCDIMYGNCLNSKLIVLY